MGRLLRSGDAVLLRHKLAAKERINPAAPTRKAVNAAHSSTNPDLTTENILSRRLRRRRLPHVFCAVRFPEGTNGITAPKTSVARRARRRNYPNSARKQS